MPASNLRPRSIERPLVNDPVAGSALACPTPEPAAVTRCRRMSAGRPLGH